MPPTRYAFELSITDVLKHETRACNEILDR
jgi:hypothetical protein